MDKAPEQPAFRRCPTCRSRVAVSAAVCPLCGHEFVLEPEAQPTDAAPVAAQPQRARFSLSQLPWGVFGVAAVIIALVAGASLLLRNQDASLPPPSTSTIMPTAEAVANLPTVLATWTPTLLPTPTNTNVPPTSVPPPPTDTPAPPVEHEIVSGDTCGGIAEKYGVPLSAFLLANNLNEFNCIIRVGDKVIIPLPTPTPGATPTLPPGVTPLPTDTPEPTATLPPQIIYQVKGGDTCSEIAELYRMPVNLLIEQNGLDSNCMLAIGQVLTLTFATPTPAFTPTPIIAQTPTPRVGYDAPLITAPQDDAVISETETVVTLQWLSAGLLKEDEWYVVQVQPTGAITVPIFETKATSIKLTRDILGEYFEREVAWWVQVKQFLGINPQTGERAYNTLSAPSVVHRFMWSRPQVFATPTPTP